MNWTAMAHRSSSNSVKFSPLIYHVHYLMLLPLSVSFCVVSLLCGVFLSVL